YTTLFRSFMSDINESFTENQKVNLFVLKKSDLGYKMVIENSRIGMLFFSDVHRDLHIGNNLTGYVKTIRPDGKIDLSLEPRGYEKVEPNAQKVLDQLLLNKGYLPYHDKTDPDTIQRVFGMSKKTFKQV